MDKAPRPEMPIEPESQEELLRKKRLLKRLEGFLGEQEEPQELNLSGDAEQEQADPEDFWSREEDGTEEALVPRLQNLGRRVLEQTRAVHGFTGELAETVQRLPEESRRAVEPEAQRLEGATEDLQEVAEELNDELDGLDESL